MISDSGDCNKGPTSCWPDCRHQFTGDCSTSHQFAGDCSTSHLCQMLDLPSANQTAKHKLLTQSKIEWEFQLTLRQADAEIKVSGILVELLCELKKKHHYMLIELFMLSVCLIRKLLLFGEAIFRYTSFIGNSKTCKAD